MTAGTDPGRVENFKKLSSHMVIYGLGEMAVKAIAFFLIPLYSRKLTVADYGVYDLVFTVQTMMVLVISLGLNSALLKIYNDVEGRIQRRKVLSTAVITVIMWGAPVALAFYLCSGPISILIFKTADNALYLKLIFTAVFFDLFRQLTLSILRALEKTVAYTVVNISHFTVLILLNIWMVAVQNKGVTGILESQLVTSIIIAVVLGIIIFRKTGFGFSVSYLKQMLRFGLPLVPGGIAAWSMMMASKFFLNHYWGEYDVGLYGIGMRFGMIVNMLLVRPFRTAWLPFALSIHKQNEAVRIYALTLTYFTTAAIWLVLMLTILGKDIIILAATEKYIAGFTAVPFIALAYLFLGMYYTVDVGLLIKGKSKTCALITCVTAAVQIGLNFLIIPKYGMLGAVSVVTFSYLLLFILMFSATRRETPVSFEIGRLTKAALGGVVIYILSLFFPGTGRIAIILLKFGLIMLFPLLLYIFNFYHKQEIFRIKSFIKSKIRNKKN